MAGVATAARRRHRCSGRRSRPPSWKAPRALPRSSAARHGIPTAAYERFTDVAKAEAFIKALGAPIVVKADGLAAGKGVIVAETVERGDRGRARHAGGHRFGAAGASVVIEEFMEGEEASFFALCDGEHVLPLAGAQDHKRAFDGDKGPNTGGMGAYSPAPVLDRRCSTAPMDEIVQPTVEAMKAEGMPFKGVLYAGLMIGRTGRKLVEYNCRFGDPECQVLMMRLKSDIVPALIACADGGLTHFDLRWSRRGGADRGDGDQGLSRRLPKRQRDPRPRRARRKVEGVQIFHAGTKRDGKRILANGGRVLNVTAHGADRRGGPRARLSRRRPDRLAGRLLPARYRLAGSRPPS